MSEASHTRAERGPAGDATIELLGPENLEDVAELLRLRNGTMPEYTRWKYGGFGRRFRGVVARRAGRAVGCFGVVPREIRVSGGTVLECGWFADWFVTPEARGCSIGGDLLRALTDHLPVVFGHPGTARAQALCLSNGFRTVRFQARRRLVLRRWQYERRRARVGGVAAARAGAGLWRAVWARRRAPLGITAPAARTTLVVSAEYASWILAQPIAPGYVRTAGVWHVDGTAIHYVDDVLRSGERRRLVLHAEPETFADLAAWRAFAREACANGCTHLDCFTTDRELDGTLAALGAEAMRDAPVVVAGLGADGEPVSLHGWDRENWTYLASDPSAP